MLFSVRLRSRYAIHQVPHNNLVCYWPSTGPLPTDINRMPSDLRFPNAVLVYCIFCNTTVFICSMQVFSHVGHFENPYFPLPTPGRKGNVGVRCCIPQMRGPHTPPRGGCPLEPCFALCTMGSDKHRRWYRWMIKIVKLYKVVMMRTPGGIIP